MTETEYLQQAKKLFNDIIDAVETQYPDLDTQIQGVVLQIENDLRDAIVINQQAPLQEIWLASREGGYHFAWNDAHWCNTRDGKDFWEYLNPLLVRVNAAASK